MTCEQRKIQLFEGDSLYFLHKLPPQSVDFICVDLPYGCTACSWDDPLPLGVLWSEYWRLMKPRATVALFGTLRYGMELDHDFFEVSRKRISEALEAE